MSAATGVLLLALLACTAGAVPAPAAQGIRKELSCPGVASTIRKFADDHPRIAAFAQTACSDKGKIAAAAAVAGMTHSAGGPLGLFRTLNFWRKALPMLLVLSCLPTCQNKVAVWDLGFSCLPAPAGALLTAAPQRYRVEELILKGVKDHDERYMFFPHSHVGEHASLPYDLCFSQRLAKSRRGVLSRICLESITFGRADRLAKANLTARSRKKRTFGGNEPIVTRVMQTPITLI